MFNDCDGSIVQETLNTVWLFRPTKAYDEVAPLTSWPEVPYAYVLGTRDRIASQQWDDRSSPSDWVSDLLRSTPGNCPQNSEPEPEMLAILIVGAPSASLPVGGGPLDA